MHRLGQGNHQQVRICPKSRVAPRKGRLAHQAPWCRPADRCLRQSDARGRTSASRLSSL
jgi:hypothetical protein